MGDSALSLWGVGLTPAGIGVQIELNPRTPAGVGKLENLYDVEKSIVIVRSVMNGETVLLQDWIVIQNLEAIEEFISKKHERRDGVEGGGGSAGLGHTDGFSLCQSMA